MRNRIVVHGEEENAAMQRKMLQGYRLETPKKKQRLEEFREGRRMKGSYQGNTLQAFIEELAEVLDMVASAGTSNESMRWKVTTTYDESPLDYPIEE